VAGHRDPQCEDCFQPSAIVGAHVPTSNAVSVTSGNRRVVAQLLCDDDERCSFLKFVSYHDPPTCSGAWCLTRCHLGSVSNSCHF
jgi:hypothetical protein